MLTFSDKKIKNVRKCSLFYFFIDIFISADLTLFGGKNEN
jgi:hypothetical protein